MIEPLTVREVDDELEKRLRRLAQEEAISLDQAALRLMRRGAGLPTEETKRPIGHALDEFIGDWSEEEEREFLQAVEVFEQVDEAFWS